MEAWSRRSWRRSGSSLGEYLLMSRFGLLAGTVAEGVDPTTQAWGLNTMGYVLFLLRSSFSSSASSSASHGAVVRTRAAIDDLVS